jgi:hypothetical protein
MSTMSAQNPVKITPGRAAAENIGGPLFVHECHCMAALFIAPACLGQWLAGHRPATQGRAGFASWADDVAIVESSLYNSALFGE